MLQTENRPKGAWLWKTGVGAAIDWEQETEGSTWGASRGSPGPCAPAPERRGEVRPLAGEAGCLPEATSSSRWGVGAHGNPSWSWAVALECRVTPAFRGVGLTSCRDRGERAGCCLLEPLEPGEVARATGVCEGCARMECARGVQGWSVQGVCEECARMECARGVRGWSVRGVC